MKRRLAPRAVRGEAVPGHLEVDEAAVGVPAGQLLPDVRLQLVLVVFALLEPPEALGAGGHLLHDGLVGETVVALDVHLADGDPAALLHVEHDPGLAAVLRQLQRLDLGGVVAGVLVERIDGRARLLHRVPVEGPALHQLHASLHGAFGDAIGAPDRPALQHGALLDLERQDQLLAGGALLDDDVVELAGAEQVGDRSLDVAVVDRLAYDESGGADDLGGCETRVAFDDDAVDDGRSLRLGLRLLGSESRRSPHEEGDGGEGGTETLHQHWVECGAPAPGAGRRRRRQAWVPVRARKTSRSPSGATSTSISSPRPNSPMRIFSLRGSSMNFWIARLSGRAP